MRNPPHAKCGMIVELRAGWQAGKLERFKRKLKCKVQASICKVEFL